MKQVRAEILTIGDEILYGQIHDTNATWISEQLDMLGVRVTHRETIGDNETDILQAFEQAKKRADIVLITGGLGPTNDDLTKPLLARFFNTPVELNEDALQEVTSLFKKFGKELTETNRRQAELPKSSTKITNKLGSAPGMWFDEEDTVFVSMPGVPFEMKAMMEHEILPRIRQRFSTATIVHRIIKTCGIGESWLADTIATWESQLPDHIKLAYLPGISEVRLRLTATGASKEQLTDEIEEQINMLSPLAGQYIYGFDSDTLESKLGAYLLDANKTIATAESCTGGFLAHKITSVPGSSAYFKGCVVSYSNEIKRDILNIPEQVLNEYGAVSEQTVRLMAENVMKLMNTDLAIATSGIAGPDGGTPEKPVGTVWIAIADAHQTEAKLLKFAKNRLINIEATAKLAMNAARQRLLQVT